MTALAECDTPAARTEAEALQPTIQRIAAASGNQADHILSSLARARCWRRGREPNDGIAVGDPHFADHRAAVMSAFQVSSEFTVPRTQLVVSALRALAPMLIATGCVPAPSGKARQLLFHVSCEVGRIGGFCGPYCWVMRPDIIRFPGSPCQDQLAVI